MSGTPSSRPNGITSTSRDSEARLPPPILVPAASKPLPIISQGSHSSHAVGSSSLTVSPNSRFLSISPKSALPPLRSESTPVILANKSHDSTSGGLRATRSNSSSAMPSYSNLRGVSSSRKHSNSTSQWGASSMASVTTATSGQTVILTTSFSGSKKGLASGTSFSRIKGTPPIQSRLDDTILLPPLQSSLVSRPMKAITASSVSSSLEPTGLERRHSEPYAEAHRDTVSSVPSSQSTFLAYPRRASYTPNYAHESSYTRSQRFDKRDVTNFGSSHRALPTIRDSAAQTSFGPFNPSDYATLSDANLSHTVDHDLEIEKEIVSLLESSVDANAPVDHRQMERSCGPDADKLLQHTAFYGDFGSYEDKNWSSLSHLELNDSTYAFHGHPLPKSESQMIARSRPNNIMAPIPQKPMLYHPHTIAHRAMSPHQTAFASMQAPPSTPHSERSVSASSEDGTSSVSSYSTLPSSISSPDSTKVVNILQGKDRSAFFSVPTTTIPMKLIANPYRR